MAVENSAPEVEEQDTAQGVEDVFLGIQLALDLVSLVPVVWVPVDLGIMAQWTLDAVLEGEVTAQVQPAFPQDPVEALPLGVQQAMPVKAMPLEMVLVAPWEMTEVGVTAVGAHAEQGVEVPLSDKKQTKMLFGEGRVNSLLMESTILYSLV